MSKAKGYWAKILDLLKAIPERFLLLVIKNLAMKVEMAAVVIWIYLREPEKSLAKFTIVVLMCALVVGTRYAIQMKQLALGIGQPISAISPRDDEGKGEP